ncbi:MAG: MFS transporter, partial [Alphaproteobacteria bacterium]|nr:MFS transporter [Alphaproteobacteria bacterium]
IARLKSNLARLGLAAETVIADASAWQTAERFDRILLDAPCSATGTIRRHPDVARLKSVADVERLADTQRRLLAWAVDLLAPGGVLVYAVCSLEAAEGPHRISSLLESGGGLRGQPIEAGEIGGLEDAITPEGALRTLPCHLADQGGMDGFYAFRLRRD